MLERYGNAWVHNSSYVDHDEQNDFGSPYIGDNTKVWHFCHICQGARIGSDCVLGQNCYVGSGAVIGDRVHIQNNVSVYDRVTLEDDVFVGPSVVFTNDMYPPSGSDNWLPTLVKRGASIGANATILPGVTIGENARIGAGSVVTHDVPDGETWVGSPARKV